MRWSCARRDISATLPPGLLGERREVPLFELIEGGALRLVITEVDRRLASQQARRGGRRTEVSREIDGTAFIGERERHGDDVGELAHVAGPIVPEELGHGVARDALEGARGVRPREEVLHEPRDVFHTVAERGEGDAHLGHAEIQVGAKGVLVDRT